MSLYCSAQHTCDLNLLYHGAELTLSLVPLWVWRNDISYVRRCSGAPALRIVSLHGCCDRLTPNSSSRAAIRAGGGAGQHIDSASSGGGASEASDGGGGGGGGGGIAALQEAQRPGLTIMGVPGTHTQHHVAYWYPSAVALFALPLPHRFWYSLCR